MNNTRISIFSLNRIEELTREIVTLREENQSSEDQTARIEELERENAILREEVMILRDENDDSGSDDNDDTIDDDDDDDADADDSYVPPVLVYGTSSLDSDSGVLIYRGGYISPSINKLLILSIVFADEVDSVVDGYDGENGTDDVGVFMGCHFLITAHINAGCKHVGSNAFQDCTSLYFVHMSPESCVKIGRCALANCSALVGLQIPSSCTYVGVGACFNCSSIITVCFDKSCSTELGDKSFQGCTSLISIDLPLLKSIPTELFYGCTSLCTVLIPPECEMIDDNAFYGTPITSIIIPEKCRRIGMFSFSRCRLLNVVVLPDNCVIDNSNTFNGCLKLSAAAERMNLKIEELLRYRYRLPKFIIPSFIAFHRCDMLKARTGSDGIGINKDKDMMVLMYRKIETADLWRKILGYVCVKEFVGDVEDDSGSDSDSDSESESEEDHDDDHDKSS